MKQISQGAEAKIYLDKNIIKERIKKSYRIKEIDEKLRGFRTRREAKILKKLSAINFPCPRLIKTDEKEKIEIEYIKGDILKNVLENKDYLSICNEIGKKIAILHSNGIIHADLTTSNMILNNLFSPLRRKKLNQNESNEIYFIDFGLSFFSHKIEDMAVDLHLLKEALESKHYKIAKGCFDKVLDGYKKESKHAGEVIKRLEVVEKRGRYKQKY